MTMVPLGGPAIIRLGGDISMRAITRSLRPVTLRRYLSIGLPFLRVRIRLVNPLTVFFGVLPLFGNSW